MSLTTSSITRLTGLALATTIATFAVLPTSEAEARSRRVHVGIHIGGAGLFIGHGLRRHGVRHIYYGGVRPCGWLKRRAWATDSPYWWRRYHACLAFRH